MNPLFSRKFILSMATLLCTTGLVAFGKIDDGVFSVVIVATVGSYLAANVAQKLKTP